MSMSQGARSWLCVGHTGLYMEIFKQSWWYVLSVNSDFQRKQFSSVLQAAASASP